MMHDIRMKEIRKEVRELISAHERLQGLLARGERLSDDEAGMVRLSATDLLTIVASPLRDDPHRTLDGEER
jgi:hypothetical protein